MYSYKDNVKFNNDCANFNQHKMTITQTSNMWVVPNKWSLQASITASVAQSSIHIKAIYY